MNVISKLFFLFLCVTPTAFSQTKDGISAIKKKYAHITELLEKNQLKKNIIEGNCENNDQNNIFLGFFYSGNVLVYINYSYSQGHSNYNYHYYIEDNKLFFYFSDYASWTWDYECAPREQGFTNEIWTYEEQRVYLENEVPIQCLYKTYEERSIDQPMESEVTLSETTKNKEVNCDKKTIDQIMKKYHLLEEAQQNTTQNVCDIVTD